jgi:hypothetical protein
MILPEYDCIPESVVGAITSQHRRRLAAVRAEFPYMKYDPAYLSYQEGNHGGIPKRQWFVTEKGTVLRLGRFVNFGGPYNKPFQDSWESPGTDIRASWKLDYLESIANVGEGCGAFLVPFGILYAGPHHPDQMQVDHANLVCFDYSDRQRQLPTVVAWENSAAGSERYACEQDGRNAWTEMNHDKFTERVASDFESFVSSLRKTNKGLTRRTNSR